MCGAVFAHNNQISEPIDAPFSPSPHLFSMSLFTLHFPLISTFTLFSSSFITLTAPLFLFPSLHLTLNHSSSLHLALLFSFFIFHYLFPALLFLSPSFFILPSIFPSLHLPLHPSLHLALHVPFTSPHTSPFFRHAPFPFPSYKSFHLAFTLHFPSHTTPLCSLPLSLPSRSCSCSLIPQLSSSLYSSISPSSLTLAPRLHPIFFILFTLLFSPS